ncbi:thiamine-phosphate pyrophosphorylase [Tribonema minus]|uniref:Thiamine-phosphate pyrophosphorylase n=1 Tax=Tribonema minus TaxID=303371 RepID=A0A836CN05_9STRA|nr:thiamine-phosphate pyrophosphorylase [Tribonema minus]
MRTGSAVLVLHTICIPWLASGLGLSGSSNYMRAQRLLPESGPVLELITPDGSAAQPSTHLAQKIRAAVSGGVRLVQIRDTTSSAESKHALATQLLLDLAAEPCCIVLNGGVDAALACGAHGVHLPERLLPEVTRAREALAVVGCSVHSVEAAVAAARLGADYLQVGTMFATQTHPGKVPEGPQLLAAIRAALNQAHARGELSDKRVLLLGVGGINEANCAQVIQAGGDGVAAIRSLCGADGSDPRAVAQALLAALQSAATPACPS